MNIILTTDSYKLTHWKMYPSTVKYVHSYLEPREGLGLQSVVWFGLLPLLKKLNAPSREDVIEANDVAKGHFGASFLFNLKGWNEITTLGYLPVRIKAHPEGTILERGQTALTIENTDPRFPWLPNALESLLMHVWYPSTVASVSYDLRKFFVEKMKNHDSSFMLHDFGYRGVSSDESAGIGGAAHLLSFNGTDTLLALQTIRNEYGGSFAEGYSVAATEHSIMTQYGESGEERLIENLIRKFPGQILSIVADSYNIYNFAKKLQKYLGLAAALGVTIVIRPDSITNIHPEPSGLVNWLLNEMPENVNVLWGDGLSAEQIKEIVTKANQPTRLVFGMGGGLLQKVNRDTLRWALKASAVSEDGNVWFPISKNPLDRSKASRAGRQDQGLRTVFEDGQIRDFDTWNVIRERVRENF